MNISRDYITLKKQIASLVDGEVDLTANLSNIVAAIKETFPWFWIGFYLVKEDELVLGPFQGPVACTRIAKGAGVCGTAWKEARSILVPDVHEFPGHIACSALSESELVIPIHSEGKVVSVLDVDSDRKNDFSDEDLLGLEHLAELIGSNWKTWK
ncbi:MAG: GAF domain-containing protein [Flavobacteriales bacterium]|nr:GAF domain-containing protein [Flavobacteriales bacterium]NNK80752.1 GAF domain-containing protein [Flavobacteriales bacterium]